MKTVNGNLDSARRCVEHIAKKFHSEGYVLKQGQEYGTYIVCVRSPTTGFLGHSKKYCACAINIMLRIGLNGSGSQLNVDASGDYDRQLATVVFGTFVAFWPVAISAVTGVFRQRALARHIEADAISFLENEASRSLHHV